MNTETILSFVTEASLGGINAINAALSNQAAQLGNLARQAISASSASQKLTQALADQKSRLADVNRQALGLNSSKYRDPFTQRFTSKEAKAEYIRQINEAVTFRDRINDVLSTIGRVKIPNLLNNLRTQLQAAPGVIRSALSSIQQSIVSKISFAGLARSMLSAARAGAAGIASLISTAARTAGGAIRSFITGALTQAHGAAQRVAGVIGGFRKLVTGAGIAGALGALFGVKAGIQVDKQLAVINTIARTTKPILDDIAAGLQRISATTGTTFDDVSNGFYDLLSAGLGFSDGVLNVVDSMQLMRDASNLAVGGLGTVTEAVDLLSSLLNAFRGPLTKEFGDPLKASTVIADAFAKSVELGKVKISEISAVISTVAPLASQLGVDFREIAAVMAVMTQQGFDAGEAMTALRSALIGIQRNSKALQKALVDPIVKSALGKAGAADWLEFLDVAGFQEFASVLRDYSERTKTPLIKLLGRIEGVQAILGTTGSQAENYAYALDQVNNSAGGAQYQQELLNDSLSAQAGLFKQALSSLGDALFRRRLVDPLKEAVKQARFFVISLNDVILSAKPLFDVLVPILTLASGLAALTAGASAIETIFIRLGGPVSGFAFGVSAIARTIALIIGPIGLVLVLLNSLNVGLREGFLPATRFAPLMERISEVFDTIGRIGGRVASVIGGVVAAISNSAPGAEFRLVSLLDDFGKVLAGDLGDLTRSIRLLISQVVDIFSSEWASSFRRQASAIGGAILTGIGSAVTYVAPRIADTFRQLLTFGGEVLTTFVEFGASVVSSMAEGIIGALPTIADAIASLFRPDPRQIIEGHPLESQTVLDAVVAMARKWGEAFLGWWTDNAPALAAGVLDVLTEVANLIGRSAPRIISSAFSFVESIVSNIVSTVEKEAPGIVDAMTTWAQEVGPKVLEFLGDFATNIVTALTDVVGKIGPPLATIAGRFIDWIAVDVIPNVAGAVARFIDEVVRSLIPLGEDNGALANPLSAAGGQLVKWITDRIPGAIDALLTWVGQIEVWLLTVALPRLGAVMIGLGAALVGSLLEGLISFKEDPVGTAAGFATRIAQIVGLILGAGVILNAASVAGAAVGLAFKAAMFVAIKVAQSVVGLLSWLARGLVGQAVAAGAAAGAAGSAAMIAAFAVPIVAVVVVALQIAGDIDRAKAQFTDQVSEFLQTSTTEGLQAGIRAIQAQIDSQKILGVIPFQWAGEVDSMEREIERIRDEIRQRMLAAHRTRESIDVPVTVNPIGIIDPVKQDYDEFNKLVERFKLGTGAIVSDWNTIPDRLKSTADLVREALAKPFSLKDLVTDFQNNYKLILTAQSSGNVQAILEANRLSTEMTTAATEINAAFVAAGQAPPLLINAITGQVTLASTATGALVDGVTTELDKVPAAAKTAGAGTKAFAAGIRDNIPGAKKAGGALYRAGTDPLHGPTVYATLFQWGQKVGGAWVNGIIATLGSKAVRISIGQAAKQAGGPLAGNSPPLEGPLREITVWGSNVGAAWVDGVITSLQDGPSRIAQAISGVSRVLAADLAGPTVQVRAEAPVYANGETAAAAGMLGTRDHPVIAKDDGEQLALLRQISSHLGLNNELTARLATDRPPGVNRVAARGTLESIRVVSGGRAG